MLLHVAAAAERRHPTTGHEELWEEVPSSIAEKDFCDLQTH